MPPFRRPLSVGDCAIPLLLLALRTVALNGDRPGEIRRSVQPSDGSSAGFPGDNRAVKVRAVADGVTLADDRVAQGRARADGRAVPDDRALERSAFTDPDVVADHARTDDTRSARDLGALADAHRSFDPRVARHARARRDAGRARAADFDATAQHVVGGATSERPTNTVAPVCTLELHRVERKPVAQELGKHLFSEVVE